MNNIEKTKKFHQFVKLERGPINTAVIDLLKEQVFQVENRIIDSLHQKKYDEIVEFMDLAVAEGLIIEVENQNWIPACGEIEERVDLEFVDRVFNIELHVEDELSLKQALEKFSNHNVCKIIYYGSLLPSFHHSIPTEKREANFERCKARQRITGELEAITEYIYAFNKANNSCWGEKMAITKDGKVRPCIYSIVEIGDIQSDDCHKILEKLQLYWKITKDNVDICKDCEFKHVCFDCREIPFRKSGNLFAANPTCQYDPYRGKWGE